MTSRNSIASFEMNRDYSPFFIGSVVGLTKYVNMNDRAVATLEATGIWVITKFGLSQETSINRHRPNMWERLVLNKDQTYMDISIALEWIPYAYPQEFEPAWEVPNHFHSAFKVKGDTYIMNSIMADYKLDGKHMFEIRIHPLARLDREQKVEGDSQDHRTIEH
jgi:hypothetical protein